MLVGPVEMGINRFVFQVTGTLISVHILTWWNAKGDPPDPGRIPVDDLIGVTVSAAKSHAAALNPSPCGRWFY